MKILNNILKFFFSTVKPVYKGQDLYGNKFFEIELYGRKRRYVEFVTTNLKFSNEWAAWLRYKRDDAPTEEEMLRNAAMFYLVKERSKKLLEEEKKNFPEFAAKLEQVEKDRYPFLCFPLHEGYESLPGQSLKYLPYGYKDKDQEMKLLEENKKRSLEEEKKKDLTKLEEQKLTKTNKKPDK